MKVKAGLHCVGVLACWPQHPSLRGARGFCRLTTLPPQLLTWRIAPFGRFWQARHPPRYAAFNQTSSPRHSSTRLHGGYTGAATRVGLLGAGLLVVLITCRSGSRAPAAPANCAASAPMIPQNERRYCIEPGYHPAISRPINPLPAGAHGLGLRSREAALNEQRSLRRSHRLWRRLRPGRRAGSRYLHPDPDCAMQHAAQRVSC
jgi:hypothetical protein